MSFACTRVILKKLSHQLPPIAFALLLLIPMKVISATLSCLMLNAVIHMCLSGEDDDSNNQLLLVECAPKSACSKLLSDING